MPNESLDTYRLKKVEEKAGEAIDRVDAVERFQEKQVDRMVTLEKSNNRFAFLCSALIVALIGSAVAIILAVPK